MKSISKIILIFALGLFLYFPVSAQIKDDPCLKAAEETADALKKSQLENESLKLQLKLKDELIALKDQNIVLVKEQSDFWKKANEAGTKIDNNSQIVVQNLREQIADYKEENIRLRSENDKLRSSRDFRTILGLGAGVVAGKFIFNK